MDSKQNQPTAGACYDKQMNNNKFEVKSPQKQQALQNKVVNTSPILSHKQLSSIQYKLLQQLVFEYKLSLEYSPAIGIYILPDEDDFYSWQFYLFVREGYYKDAKLKGIIRFDKQHDGVRIGEAVFLTDVFHPLVQFSTGKIDLQRLLKTQSHHENTNQCFIFLLKLKEMFIKEYYLSIRDSFNQQAARIYQKNQVLFIEKVFETTVIPSEYSLNGDFQKVQGGIESLKMVNNEADEIEMLRGKIKQLCPNSTLLDIEQKLTVSQPDSPQPIDSKVSRLLQIILCKQ